MHGNQLPSPYPKLSISSLEAISEAVDRLNTLGVTIRRSSLASQATKTKEFTGLNSFEDVAYLSLQTLYGDASRSLLKQLAQSMTEMYARYLHRKKPRQGRLHTYRPRVQISDPLYPILKNASVDVVQTMETNNPIPEAEKIPVVPTPQFHQSKLPGVLPRSEPTSIDSQELGAKLKKPLDPSIEKKAISSLGNLIDYPRPAKGSLICDWCFSPITADLVEEDQWR